MSTTPPHQGIYSLLFASLLSGCGTVGIPREHLRKGPVIVNPSHGFLFQDQYVYENVEQEALEKRLVEIAGTDTLEESGVYNPKSKVLREIGFYETKTESRNQNQLWYSEYTHENDTLILYHFHPVLQFPYHPPLSMTKAETVEKINGENSAQALPSGKDIKAAITFYEHYKHKKIKVEGRIADYEGILTFTLDGSANFDQLPQQANDLQMEYRGL